jgi:CRP/FNR family transcriptional regulator
MATTQIDFEARLKSGSSGSVYNFPPNIFNRNTDTDSDGTGNSVLDIARHHASDRRFVPAGTELFAEGETSDNLYVVLSGWLFLYRILEDGRRQILDFALPGAVLGYHARPESPFTFSAEAITNAEVAVIPISRVSNLLSQGSACAITLLEAANESLLGAFDTLTDVGRRTAREAIAHFLLRMARRIGAQAGANGEDAMSFPLRQEHIGDALGLTSVHVCRTLGKLRNDGLVEVGQGRLRIIDADALADDASVYCFEEDDVPLAH